VRSIFEKDVNRLVAFIVVVGLLVWWLLFDKKEFVPKDYSGVEATSLESPEGVIIEFRIPDGYTPFRGKKRLLVNKDLRMRAWAPDLVPYYPAMDKLKWDHDYDKTKYIYEERRRKIEIEIRANRKGALRKFKDQWVLPKEVKRNFQVIFDNLYHLGYSTRNSDLNPGRRYKRHPERGFIESTSPYYWYVPVDEDAHPGSYVQCTNLIFVPEPSGTCSAYRELTADTYIMYRFPGFYIKNWQAFDQQVFELVSSFLVKSNLSVTSN